MATIRKRFRDESTGTDQSPWTREKEYEDSGVTPNVTTMKSPGGKATDMKPAGQNTAQPGTGNNRGRNYLGRRVT
jgi:hypothetical protein